MTFKKFRGDCERDGCFNKIHRLDFGLFYDCLPGKISFTDVDGITEVNGYTLMLEKKAILGPIPAGQRIMFERMTGDRKTTVICFVAIDNKPTSVTHCAAFFGGKFYRWRDGSIDTVREFIRLWVDWTKQPQADVFWRREAAE